MINLEFISSQLSTWVDSCHKSRVICRVLIFECAHLNSFLKWTLLLDDKNLQEALRRKRPDYIEKTRSYSIFIYSLAVAWLLTYLPVCQVCKIIINYRLW